MNERNDGEREYALRAHQRDWEMQAQMFSSVIEVSAIALKAAQLTAGGSVVVCLAFVGAIYGHEAETARSLLSAVFAFATAAVLAGSASGFTYLSQARYGLASFSKRYDWTHPYVHDTAESTEQERKGNFWRGVAVLSVVLSYFLLLAGLGLAWCTLGRT